MHKTCTDNFMVHKRTQKLCSICLQIEQHNFFCTTVRSIVRGGFFTTVRSIGSIVQPGWNFFELKNFVP
jgi:hypothetical protein